MKSNQPIPSKKPEQVAEIGGEDMVFEFLEMSRKILTIVEHENVILQECGCLSMESYLEHRAALLKSYETQAKLMIDSFANDESDFAAKELLVSELSAVKSALAENTQFRFRSIERQLMGKKEGDAAWH